MELPNLRTVRTQRLLTQDDLAAATGMTKASISRLETGATKARISTVRKLLKALDVELEDLTTVPDGKQALANGARKDQLSQ